MRQPIMVGAISLMAALALTGCGGGSSAPDPGPGNPGGGSGGNTGGGNNPTPVNITGAVFAETSADCAVYDATYSSAVRDVGRSMSFEGLTTVTAGPASCVIQSNNIPNHDFNDGPRNQPNAVREVPKNFTLPRLPMTFAAEAALVAQNRIDGVMLNGVIIDILSAGCWDEATSRNVPAGCGPGAQWLIDPLGSGFFDEDTHNGHAQPDGSYHYHGNPNAMFDTNPGPDGSPVIGFAADGYPIYGSYFLDTNSGQVREALSGYTLKPGQRPSGPGGDYDGFYVQDWEWTDAGDLDECNGMSINGQYAYYVTNQFPWLLWCHQGTPHPSFDKTPN